MAVADKDKLLTLEGGLALKNDTDAHCALIVLNGTTWAELLASLRAGLNQKSGRAIALFVCYNGTACSILTGNNYGGYMKGYVTLSGTNANLYDFFGGPLSTDNMYTWRITASDSAPTISNFKTYFGGTDAAAVRTAISALGGTYTDTLPSFVAMNKTFSSSSSETLIDIGLMENSSSKYLIAFVPDVTVQNAATLWAVNLLSSGTYVVTQLGGSTSATAVTIGTDGVAKNSYSGGIFTRCFSLRIL